MGADLNRLYKKGKPRKAGDVQWFVRDQESVDRGYFRDAYNDGSILNKFGLSWWRDVTPLLNKDGVLAHRSVKKFRDMLNMNTFSDNIVNESPEEKEYFMDGASLLIRYLDDCIADGDGISASL